MRALRFILGLALTLGPIAAGQATSLQDVLGGLPGQKQPAASSNAQPGQGLGQDRIGAGLKEALAQGTERAVSSLGRPDGFFGNMDVRILLPQELRSLEQGLRLAGQGQMVDEFILTMNRAAERAAPEAAAIFADAIRNMTLQDARQILTGPDDAATQYFRQTSGPKLTEKFLPIVGQATDASGATAGYKRLTGSAGPAMSLLGGGFDLDRYVTGKALDGLFLMVAREEKAIRTNPAARATDLLRQVFGSR